ncbi:hypothetical protein [Priestia megaterium]|uniref:hypothetical protein n=1 Tax=Priestia megaterium TaxID=1404 RepID=UPI00367250AA
MGHNKRDIMDYYEEFTSREEVSWNKKIFSKEWLRNNKLRLIIPFIFIASLGSLLYFIFKSDESEAYISLNSSILGLESKIKLSTIRIESNNYGFGLDNPPVSIKNTNPLYLVIDDKKVLVQKNELEIKTKQIFTNKPMKITMPWPVRDGNISFLPVTNINNLGKEQGFLGKIESNGMIKGIFAKIPNEAILEYNKSLPIVLNLHPKVYSEKIYSELYIKNKKIKIKSDKITLLPLELKNKIIPISFILDNFDEIGFNHQTGIPNSIVKNMYIYLQTNNLKIDTNNAGNLSIVKSGNPQKIEVPKSTIKADSKGTMNVKIVFNGKDLISEINGTAEDMTIAEKSLFPTIWQWAKDNFTTVLGTILTTALTAFLSRESLYSRRRQDS